MPILFFSRTLIILATITLYALTLFPEWVQAAPAKAGMPAEGFAAGELVTIEDKPFNLETVQTDPLFKNWQVTAENFDPSQIKLEYFAGKIVILDFFLHTCGPCYTSLEYLRELQETYPDTFAILLVSTSFANEANATGDPIKRKMQSRENLKLFPFFRREDFPEGHFYDVDAYPRTIVLREDPKTSEWKVVFAEYGDELTTKFGNLAGTLSAMIEQNQFNLKKLKTKEQLQAEAAEAKFEALYDPIFQKYKPIRKSAKYDEIRPLLEDLVQVSADWLDACPGSIIKEPLKRIIKNSVRLYRASLDEASARAAEDALIARLEVLRDPRFTDIKGINSALWGELVTNDLDGRLPRAGVVLGDILFEKMGTDPEQWNPSYLDSIARANFNAFDFTRAIEFQRLGIEAHQRQESPPHQITAYERKIAQYEMFQRAFEAMQRPLAVPDLK